MDENIQPETSSAIVVYEPFDPTSGLKLNDPDSGDVFPSTDEEEVLENSLQILEAATEDIEEVQRTI